MRKKDESTGVNIFDMLLETSKKQERAKRKELLQSVGVKEFFEEGRIEIDMRRCKGVECKLCIKACPTNALYWRAGEVGITKELCVYCAACVLNCIVDDCIKIKRKRSDGRTEQFSKPADALALQNCICSEKRTTRTKSIFPTTDDYLKRYDKR
jgi:NAD-dependent dihydropyrimidine dehydrogenase PreA subunit